MAEADEQCIFCMIRDKKAPSIAVYEDDSTLVVFDKFPATKGHLIVIPKHHVSGIHELSEEEVSNLFITCQKVIFAQSQTLGCEGVNLVYSLGPAAGQRSPHMIVYLIPRYGEDQVSIIWNPSQISEADLKDAYEKLSNSLKDASIPTINLDKKKPVLEEPKEAPKEQEVIEGKPRIPHY